MTDEPKESLLKFPCDFTIKVIGTTSDEFETTVYGIVHKHAPDLSEGAIKLRPSSNGKYQAITVTIHAESKTQLDSIYQELSSSSPSHHGIMIEDTLIVRWLGQQEYLPCWQAMQAFTQSRDEHTIDEVWLLEHPPVFTQGQSGKPEHVLMPGNIPVVQTDRGGQVTYHGPGQLMVYILLDIKRKKLNIRELVTQLENTIIDLLAEYQIEAKAKRDAPGVYVNNQKICSIGLRIRKGCSFHGIAFNVSMDLEPFTRINPCGYAELKMTDFARCGGLTDTLASGRQLVNYLMKNLGYTTAKYYLDNHAE